MLIKSILIVTNEREYTDVVRDKILDTVNLITDSNKEVHIFKEDLVLYSLLRDNPKVKFIKGLSSGADLLLFNRMNDGVYKDTDEIGIVKEDFSDVYKRSISRNVTPVRSKAFDEEEYKTLRESVLFRRLKYSITHISSKYKFVINFTDSKDINLLNSLIPAYGDGKFIYTYDCLKNRSEFAVGGCFLPESNFESCIKEA